MRRTRALTLSSLTLGLSTFAGLSCAAILKDSSQLKESYDFIIVGAGPGGATTANRLTESANVKVLLLEAGGANDGVLAIDVPQLCVTLTPNTPWDWNFTTVPQEGLLGRTPPFPRGIGLGGTSAVNCLVYTRGTKADIDTWATLTGDEGWGWDGVLPYFKKSEKFNLPVDGHDVSRQFLPEVHGFDGVIGVSVPGAERAIDGRVIATTKELEEFPFQIDMNSGEHLAVNAGWTQALIDSGVRSSSKAYLAPEYLRRRNLDVLLHARVSRVLPTDGALALNSVEFQDGEGGEFKTLTAKEEVILSAGAVHTPVILMHSGIGDAGLLTSLNITVLVDNPSVGQNLTDHVGCGITFEVKSTKTLDEIWRNETLKDAVLEEWAENKTGLMVDTSENHIGFLRLAEDDPIWATHPDPASGPRTAHYEFLFQNGVFPTKESGNYFNLPVGNVSPASRGFVTINSSDPFAAPLIDPRLLSEDIDLYIVRQGLRAGMRFIAAKAWEGYFIRPLQNLTTDEEFDQFIREHAVSFFHPVATAAMSPANASWGVVDPSLLVKGVSGLRVVDASVVPRLPAAHTSAAVYGVAERACDIIKVAYPELFCQQWV
ncbi:alcohol oxidase [Exidia glandulosa HHB12029]|uniref:Alcohol oxidase n=1 Tax=Exidia glandulosa HHB12029 TaxID=1314781 RepID=A0A165MEZ8_EXIGL|nr:alcohol oxidase [Exidia glandulosa HHB12029]